MPRLFNDMQLLERKRLDAVKFRLGKYQQLVCAHAAHRKEVIEQVRGSIDTMDSRHDIQQFIQDLLWEHGAPIARPPFSYDLPCTVQDIEAGRLQGNPNSLFRSTLQHCMDMQKSDPSLRSLDVPRILPTLIGRIKELNGYRELGIFRISVNKDELDQLRSQLDESANYDLRSVQSAHCCAALLKEWIRLLAEPLVPTNALYEQAIEAVKGPKAASSQVGGLDATSSAPSLSADEAAEAQVAAVRRVYEALPPLNQRVLRELSLMVRDLSDPVNSDISKMTVDNLAIVFAPSFLRNPSDDPAVLLSNSKYETKFTVALFQLFIGDKPVLQ